MPAYNVTCPDPDCGKTARQYPWGKQCAHCGYGCKRLDLKVQAQGPKGKIQTEPLKSSPLFPQEAFEEREQLTLNL